MKGQNWNSFRFCNSVGNEYFVTSFITSEANMFNLILKLIFALQVDKGWACKMMNKYPVRNWKINSKQINFNLNLIQIQMTVTVMFRWAFYHQNLTAIMNCARNIMTDNVFRKITVICLITILSFVYFTKIVISNLVQLLPSHVLRIFNNNNGRIT